MPFNNQRNSRDDKSKRQRSSSENFKSKGGPSKSSSSSRGESFGKSSFGKDDKKTFGKSSFSSGRSNDRKPFGSSDRFSKEGGEDRKSSFSSGRSNDRKPFGKSDRFSKEGGEDRKSSFSSGRPNDRKPFGKSDRFSKEGGEDRKSFGRPSFSSSRPNDRKPFGKSDRFSKEGSEDRRPSFSSGRSNDRKPFGKSDRFSKEGGDDRKSFGRPSKFAKEGNVERKSTATEEYMEQRENNDFKYSANRKFRPANKPANKQNEDDGLIRLNRYISNSGICSRRKADELIHAGVISVNGEVVTELGTRVDPAKDEIRYNNERLKREKMVYVLLNKPKDYITTTDDPQERRTVMQLVAKATKERIYPVGRLDRNTTGLLLLTNDGNLADKLSHPKNGVTKIYQVELNKNLAQGDFNKIQFGLELEDGLIKPDDISYVTGASKREVGIQIHSGKNRIVRRIFESLGYEVIKLDRVVYANLTKKDLPRGRWRYLEEKELIQLKHLIK